MKITKRRKSREFAVQMLFQSDMGKQKLDQVRKTFWAAHPEADEETQGFADDLFRASYDRSEQIDSLLQKHAPHWKVDRMAVVDRNIMRAAIGEFLAYPQTPKAVVINEALEIARKYSSPESIHFLNGVLDSVGRELK